jgi:secreted PhoX family phosphatase
MQRECDGVWIAEGVGEPPSNPAPERPIGEIIAGRLNRRRLLGGLAAGAAAGLVPGLARDAGAQARRPVSTLTFKGLAHGVDETVHVADGYRTDVVIRWGDRVAAESPRFDPRRQSATAQAGQFGYNCDFIAYMPLPAGSRSSDRGLLCVNHEYTIPYLMFPGGTLLGVAARGLNRKRTDIELAAHGHSVVEVRKEGEVWHSVPGSRYGRRLSMLRSEIAISGPARGDNRLKTSRDGGGRLVVGTLNNCAGGTTPWGTVLIAEENFHMYFSGDPAGGPEARNHARYGIAGKPRYPWWGRHYRRFDVKREPNEPNRFGWIVELDPYDPESQPVKRTALGRFKHEAATTTLAADNRVVVYSGDDEAFEYVYRFVTARQFQSGNPPANRDLLDDGELSVARFDENGTVTWLPLVFGRGPLNPKNNFKSQADVLIETRRAADLLGATPMDRPEDIETDPRSGRAYVMLTKNADRSRSQIDKANPRARNRDGHILELIPPNGPGGTPDHAADVFRWEVFLLAGDPSDDDSGALYHPDTGPGGWLSAPDNCAFDRRGRLWITTDGMDRHDVADGVYGSDVTGPGRALTRQLFRGPVGAEVCGLAFTPDDRTLFVSVQHPGGDSTSYYRPSTRWPDFDPRLPPRPSVVAITRTDGGKIGD